MIIQTINLTKRYGKLIALNNLHLNIEEGECFGYIGPNGAGKTTTIKILATLLQPTWGEARVCDYVVGYQSRQIRPLIGYVPDFFGAYEDMVVLEYLEFFASAYNITGKKRTQIVGDVLELTDLTFKRDALVDSLSRGMQQRLSIARVLLHDPKILLLDEPASGLDPRARIEIRELLKELHRMGKTIIISSHILSELADLCDEVTIIDRGEVKYTGGMTELLSQTEGSEMEFTMRLNETVAGLPEALREVEGVVTVELSEQNERDLTVVLDAHHANAGAFLRVAIERGADVIEFRRQHRRLDEAFMDLTEPGVRS